MCMTTQRIIVFYFRWFIIGVFCAIILPANAQNIPVYVNAKGDDAVGNRLVYVLKEQFRRSAGFSLASREQDGVLLVHIVTINPDERVAQQSHTIYSYAISFPAGGNRSWYITSFVGACGTSRVSQCANDMIVATDKEADFFRAAIADLLEQKTR